jgi:manganese/zinc/iron transport system substrate-binding protein
MPEKPGLIRAILGTLIFGLLVVSCGSGEKKTKAGNKVLNVVVTTGMLADAVTHIGGENFNVIALMGPGVDPHLYKASEGDVEKLANADMIVYNGLHLEGKMGDILEKMSNTKPVIAAGELLPEDKLLTLPGSSGQHDPHIWFDLSLWAEMIEALGRKIARTDLLLHDDYIATAGSYADSVRALHWQIVEKIASIPKEQRVLITAHDAFSYFGRAYDMEVRGLQGISTVSEYGLKDVTDLVDFIVARGVKAIFVETSVPEKSIKAVQAGVEAKGHVVAIGGTLFSDAMGEKGKPEGTYLGMVRYNVDTIVSALK